VAPSTGVVIELSAFFGVRTAWHGSGDASPAAHAAQLD
jgi:mannonate dehydratase